MWVNSPGIRGVSPEEEKECYCGKDLQKERFQDWNERLGVMDDESGKSMESMEEVPLKELGDAELERLVRG